MITNANNNIDWALLYSYWSPIQWEVNILIGLNLAGAMLLGLVLGYERAYQGRAAGMRTYALVCMAACALTVFSGYSPQWFGGSYISGALPPDPSRVIQGIVTGIGFIGGGVIVKDGFSISGLSTAASIWTCSATGILVGVGFYGSAIILTLLSLGCMLTVPYIEGKLPQKRAIQLTVTFKEGFVPDESKIKAALQTRGYAFADNSLIVHMKKNHMQWTFSAQAIPGTPTASISTITQELSQYPGVTSFTVAHSRH